MKFIGREKELETLEREYNREHGFCVVYGRRRVGKTTLIKRFIEDKLAFYYLATQEVASNAKKRFAKMIANVTGNNALANANFDDWVDLFTLIKEYRPDEKKVIVIDELPYIIKYDRSFTSLLQYIWDEILSDSNIMLILCGSTMHMMIKSTLDKESPLYGRRTAQIKLLPLSFTTVYRDRNSGFEKAVIEYAITGGIPKYMEFFDNDKDIKENIVENILDTNGFLHEEPNFLLKDEVNSLANYVSILGAIAKGEHKIGAIASYLNVKNTDITAYMTTLIDLGIVTKIVPITEKDPSKSRKGLYIISDNFIRFWFRYIYPYKGELEFGNIQIVLEKMDRDLIEGFVAFVYENIAKDIFIDLCLKKKIDFIPSRVGKYWKDDKNNSVEFDVVAIDNTNKRLFVGECKYWQREVDKDVLYALENKVRNATELLSTFDDHDIIYGIFSKSGFTQALQDISSSRDDIYLIHEDTIL